LNITSVTPTVNVSGAGGGAGAAGPAEVSAPPGATGAAAPLGGGLGTTTTVYPLYSNSPRKKSTRPLAAFFSTTAHFTPFSSSNK